MIKVYPRKFLDYSYGNISSALAFTLNPFLDEDKIIDEIQEMWPGENLIVGLSVRTIFDSILNQKAYKKGSEVIMSGITIPDMVKIVEAHGLTVVPVDLDMDLLQVNEEDLSKVITDKTVMVVAAHLFGSIMNMDPIYSALKDRPDIFIIEDCAQAFDGVQNYTKQSKTDLSMFSFGSIKSVTALGCAIAFSKEPEIQKNIKTGFLDYERVPNSQFMFKVLKYMMMKVLSMPLIYGLFIVYCRMMKIDYDKAIVSTVRMVKNSNLLESIRKIPPKSQLRYLLHRLSNMREDHFRRRIEAGDYVRDRLENCNVHGKHNKTHSYWLFPISTDNRSSLVRALRHSGFDATFTSTQLVTVKKTGNDHEIPKNCDKYMSATIYLPVYESLPKRRLDELISVVNENT